VPTWLAQEKRGIAAIFLLKLETAANRDCGKQRLRQTEIAANRDCGKQSLLGKERLAMTPDGDFEKAIC
jgi:hypothetical protein